MSLRRTTRQAMLLDPHFPAWANVLLRYVADDCARSFATGAAVTSWTPRVDTVGAGAATGVGGPTLLRDAFGDRYDLAFPGAAGHSLHTGAFTTPIAEPFTVHLVTRVDNTAAPLWFCTDSAVNPAPYVFATNGPPISIYVNGNTIQTPAAPAVDPTTACVLAIAVDGASTEVWKNGALGGTLITDTGATLSPLRIGAHQSDASNYFNGRIADMIWCSGHQTATQIALIHKALADVYSIGGV